MAKTAVKGAVKDAELLEFVIKAFAPTTIPMRRLGEYLTQLATLLGHEERVHFVALEPGSTRILHAIERETYPKVRARITAVRTGDSADGVRAFEALDRMLRDDGAGGELRRSDAGGSASRLLRFPGAMKPLEEKYGPFNQPGQLIGTPIGVGGKTDAVNVNLEDGSEVYYCEASREVALQIAPHLFNHTIRVYGVGRYSRDEDDKWHLEKFRISHFDVLDQRPLGESIERLRGITRSAGLPVDILGKLAELREE